MQVFARLCDELDELLGLARHGAVALAADLRGLSRGLSTATSTVVAWLIS
jgi:hypothetical protein